MTEPWLTKKELARILKVSVSTVERHIEPQLRIGGQNRYVRSIAEAQLRGVPPEGGNVIPFPSTGRRAA